MVVLYISKCGKLMFFSLGHCTVKQQRCFLHVTSAAVIQPTNITQSSYLIRQKNHIERISTSNILVEGEKKQQQMD